MEARSIAGVVAIIMVVLSANGVQLAGQTGNRNKPGEAKVPPQAQKRGTQPPSPTDGIKELLRGKTVKPGDNVAYTGKTGFKLIAKIDERGEVVGWSVANPGGRIVVSVNPIAQRNTGAGPKGPTKDECDAAYRACLLQCALSPAPPGVAEFWFIYWIVLIDHWTEDPESCINQCVANYKACISKIQSIQ